MRIDEKIEKLMRHMNSQKTSDDSPDVLGGFERVYSMTNEHLYAMFENLDVKNKDILTVGSSGDQILYSILFGAKNITCFDVNPFVKYFYDYKVATIKAFNYTNFSAIAHFNPWRTEHVHWQREMLSAAVYKKISCYLPEDSKFFWDNIFVENNSVHGFFAEYPEYLPDTYFRNKEIYRALRGALKKNDCAVSFVTSDITNFIDKVGTEKKYDLILLSNIYFYFSRERDTSKRVKLFYRIVKNYEQLLKPNGKIQIDYLYHETSEEDVALLKEIKKTFGNNNISSITSKHDTDATIIYSPSKDLQK